MISFTNRTKLPRIHAFFDALFISSVNLAAQPINHATVLDSDGDGKTDLAVRRSAPGTLYFLKSPDGGKLAQETEQLEVARFLARSS